MKLIKILPIVSIGLFLFGCNATSNSSNITVEDAEKEIDKVMKEVNDLSEFPKGVQNGSITPEYYSALMTYFNGIDDFDLETQKIENDNSLSKDEKLQKHIENNNEKIVLINGIEHNPANSVEREIDKYFTEVLFYDESLSNYKSKYYSTKDELYGEMAESELVEYRQSGKVLLEILEKYELFE